MSTDSMPVDREEVPEIEEGSELNAFERFAAIVRILRRECPWDREQTHESVKHLLIEETYEAVEAIDQNDWIELENELGDVLLHVAFHAAIAEEDGRFDLEGIIRGETEKLVRRHPHVFGDEELSDSGEVVANWERIKQQEKQQEEEQEQGPEPADEGETDGETGRGADGEADPDSSVLDGVPIELPALLRAYRVQEKAAGVGFDFPQREGAWSKVEEEIEELQELVAADADSQVSDGDEDRLEAELGDLLFALVNYARFLDLNPENALRRTVDTFTRRFQHVERRLNEAHTTPEESDLSTMDRYWEEAKRLHG